MVPQVMTCIQEIEGRQRCYALSIGRFLAEQSIHYSQECQDSSPAPQAEFLWDICVLSLVQGELKIC